MSLLAALVLLLRQDPKPPLVLQRDIDDAIKRGCDHLLAAAQTGLGPVAYHEDKGITYDALVLYTLMHGGVDRKHKVVQDLTAVVRKTPPMRTYQVAMSALALAAVDAKAHRRQLAAYAQFLADTQAENGQWGYGEPYDVKAPEVPADTAGGTTSNTVIRRARRPRPAVGDNSNSQYAALGLWACSRGGFEVEESVVDLAIKWWESSQRPDGSWGYAEGGKFDAVVGSYGSMTAGGAGSVAILRRMRGRDAKSTSVKNAMAWLSNNWAVDKNAGAPTAQQAWHYYYLYAVERLGDLCATEKIGKWTWYAEGAAFLIKSQSGGVWGGPEPRMQVADTCFGILFLERSMRVATGEKK